MYTSRYREVSYQCFMLCYSQELKLRKCKKSWSLPRIHHTSAFQSSLTASFPSPYLKSSTEVMCHSSKGKIPMVVSRKFRVYSSLFCLLCSLMYSLADGKSKVIKEYSFIIGYGFDIYHQKVIYNLWF